MRFLLFVYLLIHLQLITATRIRRNIEIDGAGSVTYTCQDGFSFKGTLSYLWLNQHLNPPYTVNFVGMDGTDASSYCKIDELNGDFDGAGTFGKCARKTIAGDDNQIVLVYMIQALPTLGSEVISRTGGGVTLTFECSVGSSSDVTFGSTPTVQMGNIAFDEGETSGELALDFKLITEGTILANEKIEFSANLNEQVSPKVALYWESCWVTKTEEANEGTKYDLIVDNCQKDSTFTVESSGLQTAKMSFTSFLWLEKASDPLFVHCKIRSCFGECDEECSDRKKRSLVESSHVVKTYGPIIVDNAAVQNFGHLSESCDPTVLGCSQGCDVIENDVHCSCFPGYELLSDGTTCSEKDDGSMFFIITWVYASISVLIILVMWLRFTKD